MREQNTEKLLSGAQRPRNPSPPRLFQNNRAERTRLCRPGRQAVQELSERTALRSQRGNRVRISPQLFLPGVGCPGKGVPGSLEEPAETLVEGAARARPRIRALLRPSLTFQREPAARIVLPRTRPHHPGHSSGQRGHPGGSFVGHLYPGKGEIGRRARRRQPSGTPPERGEPLPKEAGDGGRAVGRGAARFSSRERGAREGTGLGSQSPGFRARGGRKVYWESGRVGPARLGRWGGVSERRAEPGKGVGPGARPAGVSSCRDTKCGDPGS